MEHHEEEPRLPINPVRDHEGEYEVETQASAFASLTLTYQELKEEEAPQHSSMVPTNEYAGYFIQTTILKEEEKHTKMAMHSKKNHGTERELFKLQEIVIAPQ